MRLRRRRKKNARWAFFDFMSLRGTAQKRPATGPLLTLGNQREDPLDTPERYFSCGVENTNETDVPSVWEVDSG